jgi:hypothetical protein
MKAISRRSCLALGSAALFSNPAQAQLAYQLEAKKENAPSQPALRRPLPMSTIFKGEARFNGIVKKALKEDWGKLPMNERLMKCAYELRGLPYQNFTLEIDDHIESPSVNLDGLDCWTFFAPCLGMARMLGAPKSQYSPENLLREIQFTRYRGGHCSGNYLERIHYLAEWFIENDARGTCNYITPGLPGAEQIQGRKISEMTILWKSYRYLKNNPELRAPMKETEDRVAAMPVHYIPKSKVAAIEPQLRDGDVIGIATKHHGGYCSHVGLISRTKDGVARFMHASRNYKKVVVDKSISGYLNDFSSHAGMIVGRPLELNETVTDAAQYQANLKKLIS